MITATQWFTDSWRDNLFGGGMILALTLWLAWLWWKKL